MTTNKTEHYLVLDADRGIAALAVFIYHLKTFVFPDIKVPGILTLSSSYLAVDLFFLMSGIVLSKAYETRIKNEEMSFLRFIKVRFFRLYPLYFLGLALGLGYMVIKAFIDAEPVDTAANLGRSLTLNLFFLPDFWNGKDIFIFNPASWSLSLEWIINIIFVLALVKFSNKALIVITILSGAALAYLGFENQNIDLGWSGENFDGGLARIAFSFTLGIFIYRLLQNPRLKLISWSGGMTLALLVCLLFALIHPPSWTSVYYDFFLVYVFFPIFCFLSCNAATPQFLSKAFSVLGQVSYALYILHTPLILWFAGFWKFFAGDDIQGAASISLPFIIILVCLTSYLATVLFDAPIRKIMSGILKKNAH